MLNHIRISLYCGPEIIVVAGFEVLLLKTSVCAALRTFGQIGVDVAISSELRWTGSQITRVAYIKSTYTYVRRERVIFHFIRSGGKTSLRQAVNAVAPSCVPTMAKITNTATRIIRILPLLPSLRSFKYTALLSRQNNGS